MKVKKTAELNALTGSGIEETDSDMHSAF